MRSLEPSTTFTCTLMVSPGPKAGMSSRSDALSTKSSVFIGDTSLLFAAAGIRHQCDVMAEPRSSYIGFISQQPEAQKPWAVPDVRRQLLNCARRRPSGEIASCRPRLGPPRHHPQHPGVRGREARQERLQLPPPDWPATTSSTVKPKRLVTPLSRGGPCTGGRRRC